VKKLKVGIIGAGGMGKIHAGCYMNNPNVEVAAACEKDREKLDDFVDCKWGKVEYEDALGGFRPKYRIKKAYTDYKEIARDGKIDAVSICTPNVFHFPIAREMMENGKNVLVEKPMGVSVSECKVLTELAEKNKVILASGHMWRFHPDVIFVREIIESGLLGKIVKTKSYGIHVNWVPKGWFVKKELAKGGALIDMGIHAIDTTKFLLGDIKPKRVWADINTCYGEWNVDDSAVLIIEFERGVTSIIESGWNNPYADGGEASTQIFGTKGYARVFPTEVRYFLERRQGIFRPEKKEPHQSLFMYQREIDHFVECILNKKRPINSGEIGLEAIKIVEAAYESSKEKRFIQIN